MNKVKQWKDRFWFPKLVDADYIIKLRKDYPEETSAMDDDTIKDGYYFIEYKYLIGVEGWYVYFYVSPTVRAIRECGPFENRDKAEKKCEALNVK